MLHLEQLVEAVITDEGQTLMGLDFLIEALNLPMRKIDLIFKKALGEYSERRPMKKDGMFTGTNGVIQMPEGTTSCRVARYGVLEEAPRYYLPKIGTGSSDQYIEFNPYDLTVKVWPPISPVRLTYTQRYVPTTSILIENIFNPVYEMSSYSTVLDSSYAGTTLKIQKTVTVSGVATVLEMAPTGTVTEEEDIYGDTSRIATLSGTLGTGTFNLDTREMELTLLNSDIAPIVTTYYPKYSVVKELSLADRLFNMLFASRFLTAIASLKQQATQANLHNIDITTDDILARATELRKEVEEKIGSAFNYGDTAPV